MQKTRKHLNFQILPNGDTFHPVNKTAIAEILEKLLMYS